MFLGRVDRIITDTATYANRVEFTVDEPYVGNVGHHIIAYTASNEAACGYSFSAGEQYVVYAYLTPKGELHISLCSHTRPAKYAAEDIEYLRSLPSRAPTASIQGSLWRYTHDPNFKPSFQPSIMDHYRPPEQTYMAMEPVPGTTIKAVGEKGDEFTTTVRSDGDWEILGLNPGTYIVKPVVASDVYVHPYIGKVTVVAKGCAGVPIRIETNGRIGGELGLDPHDPDWGVVYVFALPVDKPDLRHPAAETISEDGKPAFDLAPLQPGKYIVGAYLAKKVSVNKDAFTFRDVQPTYYPGVLDIHQAIAVSIEKELHATGINFRMLPAGFLPDMWRCENCK